MARRSKIEEGLQRQIMGHSPGDIPGEYGDGFDEYRVVEAMRQYRVPGLTFSRNEIPTKYATIAFANIFIP